MAQSWEDKAIQAAGRRWTEAYKKNDKRGMAKAAAEAARIRATQGYKLNAGVSGSTPVVQSKEKFQGVKTGGTVLGIGAKTAEQRYNPYAHVTEVVKESTKPKPKPQWQNSQRPNSYYSSPSMSLKEKPSTKKVLNEGLKYNIKNSAATRGYMGIMGGYVPASLDNVYSQQFGNDTVDYMKNTTSYNVGEVAGTIGQYASAYGLGAVAGLGKAVTAIPKVSQMGALGQGLARSAAFDLVLGTPLNTLNAVSHGYRGEDLAKQVATMGAVDLALGGVFELGAAGFRGVRQAMANRAARQIPVVQLGGGVKVTTVPRSTVEVPPNTLQRFRVGSEANASAAQRGRVAAESPASQTKRIQVQGAIPAKRKEAAAVYGQAVSLQRNLNNMLSDISKDVGLVYTPSTQKSIQSMVNKVVRKSTPDKPYGLLDMKDHARGKVDLNSFDQIPEVLAKLTERKIPYETEAITTEWGYKGFHITYRNADGLGAEIQLTTPEVWKVKKESDLIYERWRNVTDIGTLSPAEQMQYYNDLERSLQMWDQLKLPDLSRFSNSSAESLRALKISSADTGADALSHLPLENSHTPLPSRSVDVSIKRPDSVKQAMDSSPFDNKSIPQNTDRINVQHSENGVSRGLDWNNEADRSSVLWQIKEAQQRGDLETSTRLLDFYENKFKDLGADTAKRFNNSDELIKEYGAIRRGEHVYVNGEDVTRDIKVPKSTQYGDTGQFARTAAEGKVLDDKMVDEILDGVKHGDFAGTKKTNKVAVDNANTLIDSKGLDHAYNTYTGNAELNKAVTSEDIALGSRLVQELQRAGKYEDALEVTQILTMQLQEAGRAVQAARILKRLSPDGRIQTVSRITDKIKSLTGTEVAISEQTLENLRRAVTENDIVKSFKDARVEIWNQTPANWVDKLNAWRYTAMLGNPKTIIRNEAGNALFYPVRMIKNVIGAGLEKTAQRAGRLQVGQRTKTILTNADKELKEAARNDFENVVDILKSGGKYNDLAGQTRMFRELDAKVFDNRFLEAFRKLTNQALEDGLGSKKLIRGDTGWLNLIYTDSLAQYMRANGYGIKEFGDDFIMQQAREYAMNEALKGTYRDANALSSFLSRTSRNLINSNSMASKAVGWMMEGAVPFKKTPANILRRGMEYSPAGLMEGIGRTLYALKKGEGLSAALDKLASGITGTGLVALGYFLAQGGILNGTSGKDKVAQYENMNGNQEYSANIGDYTYTMDWAAPSSMPLFVGVELHNLFKDKISFVNFLDSMKDITAPVFNMSMLQGVSNLFDTGYSESGVDTALAPITNTAYSFAGQFVPTLSGQIARTIDPIGRRTNTTGAESETIRNVGYNVNKSFVAKIPGLEQTRQPYVDLWGRTQEKQTAGDYAMSAIQNFISPGYISERNETNVDRQLNSLANQIGGSQGNAVYPRATKEYEIKVDGVNYRMTAAEKTRYAQVRGQASLSEVREFFNSAEFRRMDAAERKRQLGKIYDYAEDVAKEDFMRNRR